MKAVYRFLRDGLIAWASGVLDQHVPEPWRQYRERIRAAAEDLQRIADESERVLLVTSGGPMSQLAQLALDLPDARAVELNLTIRNSGVCEFHSTEDGLRLASWNTLPHLTGSEHRPMWTHY
jgi:broad specificity phosphatase PhoE